MSADDRYRPPAAAVADVADVGAPLTFSRAPVITLLIIGALAIAWLVWWMPVYLRLVGDNAMNPAAFFVGVAGALCLCVALLRAWPRGLRGLKTFVAALLLLALSLVLLDGASSLKLALWPFLLAGFVAFAGGLLVRTRLRAMKGLR